MSIDDDLTSDDEAAADEHPISAIPPLVTNPEDMRAEVGGSPAFQSLEELFEAGKISGSRMVELKSKYKNLYQYLMQIRESESANMERAKKYSILLEKQKEELEEADNSTINHDTEIGRMREDYLKKMNQLGQIDDRSSQLQYKMETLNEELRLIKLEYSRMSKPDAVEQLKRESQEQNEALKKEIAQTYVEIKNLKEELQLMKKQREANASELVKRAGIQNDLKNEMVVIQSVPANITKASDKIVRQIKEVDDDIKKQTKEMNAINDEFKQLTNRHKKVEREKDEVSRDVEQCRGLLKGKEYEFSNLQRDYDFEKEREAVLLGDRATIDLALRHATLEKKSTHEELKKQQTENERIIKELKKVQTQAQAAQDGFALMRNIYDKIREEASQYPDESPFLKKRKQLKLEVDEAKKKHAQQTVLSSVEQVKVEDLIMVEERLMKQQQDLRSTVVDFHRLAQIKADEREQKSRDFVRAEQRYHKSVKELKNKQLSLVDHNKKFIEVKVHLQEFAKLYNTIKNERNKCVNQIQSCTQKSVEMREKVRILANEIEILRNSVLSHDKDLQRARLKMMNTLVARDTLRNEQTKAVKHERSLMEEREQLKMEISRLNMLNNQAEENMVQLRKRYEESVQHRNDRGVQLVEREEEVCIFYEKLNVQETMLKNGDLKLNELQDEIKFLKLQRAEDLRLLELTRNNNPKLKNLNDELVTLQIQLSQCEDRKRALEKECEDSDGAYRIRMLGGTDPSPTDLQSAIENLELKLAEKEEKILELELVFEQSSRLADRLDKKVESGKDDSLTLAKKVNDYQSKTKKVTRKMMSLVSELSMKQAEVIKLQQEVKTAEGDLHQCYIKLEQGDAPNERIEEDWQRCLRKEKQREHDQLQRELMAQEELNFELPDGSATTAEPRPNAYIPDEANSLPLPRPYGALAPFKPSDNGSNMRHIRKPVLKPIEI